MLVALLVCLIPTTIGGLLSAIGIAGMDRLVQRNVLAMSGRAVEAAGDVTTLLLDKTGTITYGSRQAAEMIPVTGVTERELADGALASSLADETPEGRSIVDLAVREYGLVIVEDPGAVLVPFTAQTRMSGLDMTSGRQGAQGSRRLGAPVRRGRGRPRAARGRPDRRAASRAMAPPRWSSPSRPTHRRVGGSSASSGSRTP